MLVLVLITLVVSIVALVLAAATSRRTPRRSAADGPDGVDALPQDVLGLRQEVAALRAEARGALRQLGVIRYDAFEDMGGAMSWSLALLDDDGDGVVLTSIHGRSDARSYAKNVSRWTCEQQLSPEESEAIASARPDATSA